MPSSLASKGHISVLGVAFRGDGTVSEERLQELLSHPEATEFGLWGGLDVETGGKKTGIPFPGSTRPKAQFASCSEVLELLKECSGRLKV